MVFGALEGSGKFSLLTANGRTNLTVGGNNATTTYSGLISGSGSLVKVGGGLMTLAATNSYTGGTTVNGGTLALNANGNGYGTIQGALTINQGAVVSLLISNALGYTTGVSVTQVNINGGILDATAAGVGDEGYLANYTLTGGSITNSGGGDDFAIQGGYSVTTIGTNVSSVIAAPVQLRNQNTVTFNVGQGTVPGGVDLLVSGAISGGYSLTKTGNGLMQLTAANSYNGTTLQAGTVQLGNNAALGANTGTLTVNGGLVDLHGFSPAVGALSGSGGVIDNLVATASTLTVGSGGTGGAYSGTIQNTSGPLTLAVAGGTQVLSGTNTYTGGTILNGGLLNFTPSALPFTTNPPNITFNGGGLQYAAGNTEDLSPAIVPVAAGQAAIIDTGTNNVTFGTPLSGAGGLTKAGAGVLTLSVSNSFTGPTTVNGGTLTVGNAAALQSSDVTANSTVGFTVAAASLGSLSGSGNVNLSGATVTAGGLNTSTVFNGSIVGNGNGFVKTGTGVMSVTNTNNYTGPTTIASGTLRLGAASVFTSGTTAMPAPVAYYNFAGLGAAAASLAANTIIPNLGTGGTAMNGTVNGNALTVVQGPKGATGQPGFHGRGACHIQATTTSTLTAPVPRVPSALGRFPPGSIPPRPAPPCSACSVPAGNPSG